MSSSTKLICAAAFLAISIPAGCTSTSHLSSQERPRRIHNPQALAAVERELLDNALAGGVQLGASDGLGQSLHTWHTMMTMARHNKTHGGVIANVSTDQED